MVVDRQDVKAKVREKKSFYHVFLGEKTADNWRKYQQAKKAAKMAVAVAKASHSEMSARSSSHAMVSGICTDLIGIAIGINDEKGHLPVNRKKAFRGDGAITLRKSLR
ncbi:unnamed protein product [Heligmosomoides polygyrus]|uniref:AP2/ERF domain-containing protein n=1 Tax=Heligmosomoides polygyrus TaxID=6339 RepID=A0A183GRU7_HELPZ|nr:unnamed protein product [Heligmosomoides polygyrus]